MTYALIEPIQFLPIQKQVFTLMKLLNLLTETAMYNSARMKRSVRVDPKPGV